MRQNSRSAAAPDLVESGSFAAAERTAHHCYKAEGKRIKGFIIMGDWNILRLTPHALTEFVSWEGMDIGQIRKLKISRVLLLFTRFSEDGRSIRAVDSNGKAFINLMKQGISGLYECQLLYTQGLPAEGSDNGSW
jgi:hypothetical protein